MTLASINYPKHLIDKYKIYNITSTIKVITEANDFLSLKTPCQIKFSPSLSQLHINFKKYCNKAFSTFIPTSPKLNKKTYKKNRGLKLLITSKRLKQIFPPLSQLQLNLKKNISSKKNRGSILLITSKHLIIFSIFICKKIRFS